MPKINKKHNYRASEENYSRVKGIVRKQTSPELQKKLKAALNNYNTNDKFQDSFTSTNLSNTDSSDSVIYVGSYTLHEKYPLIDLTNSLTSMRSEETVIPLRRYPNLINCHTVFTSLVRNQSINCTASTSRLLESLEGSKLNSKSRSKSTSCLIVVNDHKHVDKFKIIDICEEAHLLSSKEKSYIDQVTQLTKDDHDIINHALEIGEDISIMETCSPERILNSDVPFDKLMQMYAVNHHDEFL